MRPFRRPQLGVEALEQRDCPALGIKYVAGYLLIRGVPEADLNVKSLPNGLFQVKDGSVNLGKYRIGGGLDIRLAHRPGDVNVNLNGRVLPGFVYLDLGRGAVGANADTASVNVFDSKATTGLGNGTVRGSVTIVRGNGGERINVGGKFDSGTMTTTVLPITVRGNTTYAARAGQLKTDQFNVGEGSVIRGNLSLYQVESAAISLLDATITDGTEVRGNVLVNYRGAHTGLSYDLNGFFGRNVTINAGDTGTTSSNSFTLQPPEDGVETTVMGKLTVTFGHAMLNNTFEILAEATSTSTIEENVTFRSLNDFDDFTSADRVLIEGTIWGSVVSRLGTGINEFSFEPGAFINGDLTYFGADDTNLIGVSGVFTNTFEGELGGDLTIRVGNGTNETFIGSGLFGFFTYRGGDGDNSVTIAPVVDDNYLYFLDLFFGLGVNELELDATNVTAPNEMQVTGIIEGTPGAISNTFTLTDPNGTLNLLPTLLQINWP